MTDEHVKRSSKLVTVQFELANWTEQMNDWTESCPTLCCGPKDCSTPGFPVHHQLLEFTQTHVHWVSDVISHLILCRPLLLPPSIFPSIRGFSNESVLHIRWPKYWSFSFSISPSNEYSGRISFRMNWLDLLAVQGTLKSLLQYHSSKASTFWCSAFFTVQLSHPYMTTGKTIALTRRTFVGKVISLLFNMLSRLVITFLPRSKHLLISWLQSQFAVTLEPKKIVGYCFHCFPIYLPWSDGTRCHDLSFLNVKTMRCQYIPLRIFTMKSLTIPCVAKTWSSWDLHILLVGMGNSTITLEHTLVVY